VIRDYVITSFRLSVFYFTNPSISGKYFANTEQNAWLRIICIHTRTALWCSAEDKPLRRSGKLKLLCFTLAHHCISNIQLAAYSKRFHRQSKTSPPLPLTSFACSKYTALLFSSFNDRVFLGRLRNSYFDFRIWLISAIPSFICWMVVWPRTCLWQWQDVKDLQCNYTKVANAYLKFLNKLISQQIHFEKIFEKLRIES